MKKVSTISHIQVMRRHRLTCNPNLCEEGVRGRLEAHGLVLVLVCGTLHTSSNVCGVFEQVLDFFVPSYTKFSVYLGFWSCPGPWCSEQLEDQEH